MTPTSRTPGALPDLDDLHHVCQVAGIDADEARPLHRRSNAVYLLPRPRVVARLAPATPLRLQRARTAIAVTRWLAAQPHPVALAPLPGEQPVVVGDTVATFWPLRAAEPAPIDALATLLRRLHTLPIPPFAMPHYRPLHRLHEALEIDSKRRPPTLSEDERRWITDRAGVLLDAYRTLDFPLGIGVVHADAHLENVVRDDSGWLLIDWDQACVGPRELDLLCSLPDRFHAPEEERRAFSTAYGYDLTRWPHWKVLRGISELHSLGTYIRLAPGKPSAAEELGIRLRSLRIGDRSVRWHAVS